MENPIRITYIQAMQTQSKRQTIGLFAPPLQYPVLDLFESQFALLTEIGIDPNKIIRQAEPYYCSFYAHWQETLRPDGNVKLNSKGNPYTLVTKLKSNEPSHQVFAILGRILNRLDKIQLLLNTKPTPEVQMFYKYGDGDEADPYNMEEQSVFDAYKEEEDKIPYSKATLRQWFTDRMINRENV